MTNLKDFHSTLENIKVMREKVNDLNDCYDKNESSFDYNSTMCTVSANGSSVLFKDLYGELLENAYGSNNYPSFIQDLKDINGGLQNTLSNTNISDKHSEIKALRSKLDDKMKHLYNPAMDDVYMEHTSSVYTSFAWTVLATSVLYYLISKLS